MYNENLFAPIFSDIVNQEAISKVYKAIDDLKSGSPVLIIDDEIEGEGDICVAAETASADVVNFMISAGRGIVCQPITPSISKALALPVMVPDGGSPAFSITADAIGVGSGTSAHDRAYTARVIANPETQASDLVRPGHIFPIVAKAGGVLERPGHTESSIDIVRLAGFTPSSVICEVIDDDGHMATGDVLMNFAEKYGLMTITVRNIINFCQLVKDSSMDAKQILFEAVPQRGNGNGHR